MSVRPNVLGFNRALIRYAPRAFVVQSALQIFYLGSMVLPGLVEKAIFDSITGAAQLRVGLWALIALYVAIGLARMASTYAETYAGATFRYVTGALIRHNLFAALLRRPGALPQPVPSGEAINRYRTDVAEVCDFPLWFPDVAGNLVAFVAAVAIMASISWQITLVAFLPILVAFVVGRTAWSRMLLYRKLEGEAGDRVTGYLAEMFDAVQALKVAGARAERNAVRRFERLNDERGHTAIRARILDVFVYSIHSFAVIVSTGVMLLMASRGMIDGSFTVGDFALFTYFLWFTSEFPSYLGSFVGDFKQQEVALARLAELAPEEGIPALIEHHPALPYQERPEWMVAPTMESSSAAVDAARSGGDVPLRELEVRALTSLRDEAGHGIRSVTFTLPAAGFTVITGQVGAGKTTLLRAILGLLPVQGGEIRWNGARIDEPAAFFRPPRSAYTPQTPRLFSDTLRENILQGASADQSELEAALADAVLELDVSRLERGLDTVVGPRGVRLSGGQAQRTAAARMFVRRPSLLVFDDLSSALDVETERVMWERLAAWPDRPAILAVSHRRAALSRADQIIVLKEGRVESMGTAQELLEQSPEFRKLWRGVNE